MCLKTPGSGEIFLPNMRKTLVLQELCLKNLELLWGYSYTVGQDRSIGATGGWQRLLFYHSVCSAHFTSLLSYQEQAAIKHHPSKTRLGFWLLNGILTKTTTFICKPKDYNEKTFSQNIDITMTVPLQAGLLNSFLWKL